MSFNPMTNSEKELFLMIQNDDLNGFIGPYDRNQFVNREVENSEGITLLGEAVKRNAIKIAEYIIDVNPGEMNRKNKKGQIAISHIPIIEPKKEIIDLFEKKGFNLKSNLGASGNILHLLAPNASVEVFKYATEKGISLEEKNIKNETPHDTARRWGNHDVDLYIVENHTKGMQSKFDFTM